MGKYRQNKVNEAVVEEMAVILRGVKDPRVSDNFVTVTAARVSPDFRYAKLWYSSLSADAEEKREIRRGLMSAAGYIRSKLAERLNLRITPELSFEEDTSMENGAHIASVLKTIKETSDRIEAERADSESQSGGEGGADDE